MEKITTSNWDVHYVEGRKVHTPQESKLRYHSAEKSNCFCTKKIN